MDVECACGGKGGLHVGECPVVLKNQKPVKLTYEQLEQRVAMLQETVERYARAVDIAQRSLANV